MKGIYLFPGELQVSAQPALITTILGSCVGVALFDPVHKIGGLNHYLLPKVSAGENPSCRYGEYAIPRLIRELNELGSQTKHLQAKLFGGAAVLSDVKIGDGIGELNVSIALELLAALHIPIMAQDIGGKYGRKIVFNTESFYVQSTVNSDMRKSA